MKKIVAAIALGTVLGIASAKLPPSPAKSDAEKAAEAEKAAAGKAKEAAELAKAQDKAVANYKRNAAAMERKK
jgi:hypothetical protein